MNPYRLALVVSPLLAALACAETVAPPPAPLAPPTPLPSALPAASAGLPQREAPPPPTTRRDDFKETLHGVDVVDPYRWLEDDRAPETRAWIDAQNAYSHGLLDGRPGREAIRARLEALARSDTQGLPRARGKRYFTWRRAPNEELWTYHVSLGLGGKDEVLLDPHPLSPDHSTAISTLDGLKDGSRLLYSIRRGGEDETELHVLDVDHRRDVGEVLPRALYRGGSLDADGRGFLYALQDRAIGVRVRHHVLGTPVARDVEVFGAGYGPSDWVGGWNTEDGRHTLFTVSHGWAGSEVFLRDASTGGRIAPIVQGLRGHFDPGFAGERLVVKTDHDAPHGRIVEIDPRHPEPARWRTIVPEGPDAIVDADLYGGRVLVQTLHDVATHLLVYSLDGALEGEVALPGLGTVQGTTGHFDSDEVFFAFTSYTVPWRAMRLSMKTRETSVAWAPDMPFRSDDYVTEQIFATSKDGTRVPVFLVHARAMPRDVPHPTVLYGYGGFDVSEQPDFSSSVAWLVEHGFVYAQATLRGGGEYGEAWHEAGMLDKKQNVFDDFIAAAEWLEQHGVTTPEKLAIQGGSNGGLLVGAVMTQRPELFRAVLCEFPDLDMLGYWRFKNNNPPALLEYGDASKPEQFAYLAKYSPYQHVVPGARYPAVLLTTGDEDTRVPPLQARKMTARLQAATSSGHPVLILYDDKAGHAGGKPLGKALDDESRELAFLAWQLGVEAR